CSAAMQSGFPATSLISRAEAEGKRPASSAPPGAEPMDLIAPKVTSLDRSYRRNDSAWSIADSLAGAAGLLFLNTFHFYNALTTTIDPKSFSMGRINHEITIRAEAGGLGRDRRSHRHDARRVPGIRLVYRRLGRGNGAEPGPRGRGRRLRAGLRATGRQRAGSAHAHDGRAPMAARPFRAECGVGERRRGAL